MKTVLLTGGHGFLGQYIRAALLANKHTVITLGRQSFNDLVADISADIELPVSAMNWVVHAAGKAHLVPHNAEQAADFFNTNLKGTQHLCQWLQKGPVMPEAFVFISTVSVYGVEEGKLISETHPLAGTSPYAQSKIQAEAWLQQWCSTHGVALTILRLPLIAGINAPGNLGAMINAIKGGKYFNIGEGNAQKSIVLAEDVAQWIPVFTQHPGIYNLTDGQHPSFAQLAALIASQLGKGMPRSIPHWLALPAAFAGNYMGARAPLNCDRLRKITATLTFDDTKARQVFGWKPKPVLEHFKIN